MFNKILKRYSPNFSLPKRVGSTLRFIIIHYTGMKKESEAIERLTNAKSKVSSHYFIKSNGEIINLIPDLYTAWHAGKSKWQKFNYLNKNSIGIEINNPGHDHGYSNFKKKQINSLIKLTKYLIQKYKIKKFNILGHSDVAPDRKKDPGEKFPWRYLSKRKIGFWHKITYQVLKKSRNQKIDIKSQNIFFKNLNKIGYVINSNINFSKKKNKGLITQAFQRRFRQELINGKIDKECFLISKNIAKLIK